MDDMQLAELCAKTAGAAEDASFWVDRNKAGVGTKSHSLRRILRRQAELARKYERAARRPLCIGIFGASQVGKSYLISTLARKGTNPLIAMLDREYDFIREIGPEKDQEATGLVTRFSIHSTGAPASHPVAVRLLSQTDLVKILANTYFFDFKATEELVPSPEEITAALTEANARVQPREVDSLKDTDIDDLRGYCTERFKARRTIDNLGSGYWDQLEEIAPRLNIDDRVNLYSFLWGRLPELTNLYKQLYLALQGLDFASEAHCVIDALIPRETSILDVETLKELASPKGPQIEVVASKTKRRHSIPRAYLTAIVAELLIQIKDQPRDYSQFTDILDFPGARSRLQNEDPQKYVRREGVHGLFLRGKVAYLFDRYCDERELTGMLLCVPPSNPEVQTLPDMVVQWVHNSHGPTSADRAKVPTALFLVLTKFDLRFKESAGLDSKTSEEIEELWSAAMRTGVTEHFGKGKDPWPREWHPNSPFNNCFWLRSPNFKARNLIEYDANGREVGIVDPARIARYQQGYLSSPLIRSHFRDPDAAWNAALSFNDGGATYLADALSPICRPELKLKQITARLEVLRRDVREALTEFQVSDDVEAELRKRLEAAQNAIRSVGRSVGHHFVHLLNEFQVGSDDLQVLFKRTKLDSERSGDQKVTDGKAPDWDIILGGVLDGAAPPDKGSNGAKPHRDRYADLAATALEHWAARLQDLPRDAQILSFLQVEPDAVETIVREIIAGTERIDLTEQIAREMRETNPAIDEMTKPAMASAEAINRYVWHLGQDAIPIAERARRPGRNGSNPVFEPREPVDSIDTLDDGEPHAQGFIMDWLSSFIDLTKRNSKGGTQQKFSPDESRALNGIVTQLGG